MILDASERETLEFLRAVFEKANDMITVVDTADLRYVEANEVAERMLGYTREEIRALTVLDLHVPDDHPRVADIRARLDRDGQLRTTLSYRRKDGLVFPVEMSLCRIKVGSRLLTLNIARDITERVRDIEHMRKQAEDLEEAKGFLEALREHATDGLSVVNEAGIVVYVNARQAAMNRRPREEVIGRHFLEFVAPEHRELSMEQFRRTLAGEEMRNRIRVSDPAGGVIVMDANSVKVEWAGQRYVFSIIRDVTALERQAEELAQAKGFLEALQEHAIDGLSIVDEAGRVYYVNSRQADMIGQRRDQILGRHYHDFVTPDHRAVADELMSGALAGREVRRRLRVPHTDGRLLVLETSSVAVAWGGHRFVFSSTRDVTAEVRQAEELAQAKGFLEAIQEHAQDAVFLMDAAGRFLFLNAKAVELMQRRREDVIGRHYNEFSPEPLRKQREEQYRRILEEGAIHVRERMHPPGGRVREVDIVSSRVRWGDKDYVVSAVRDITDQVQIETSIRLSRERMAKQQAALVALTQGDAFVSGDLSGALRLLTETAAATVGTARVGIWRFSADRKAIFCADLFEAATSAHSAGQEILAADHSSYFAALEETEVLAADDARRDPRTSEFTEAYLVPAGITSMMDAPIHLRGRLDGVLCFEHIGPAREWLPDEKTFAVAMANLVSLMLGRWEQKRLERRLETQYAVARVLAEAAAVVDAAPHVLREIGRGLGWVFGALWLVDAKAKALRCQVAWSADGLDPGEFGRVTASRTFAPGVGLPGRVWAGRQAAWIRDVTRDPNFPRAPLAAAAGLHGAFGFPIIVGDEVLGVMEFFHPEVLEPDDDLLQVIASVGSQVGQFIHRKRAEEALRESEERYRSVVAAMDEGIVLLGPDGQIQACNRSAETILGLTTDEFTQRTGFDPRWLVVREDGVTPFPTEDWAVNITRMTGRPVRNFVCGVLRPDGARTWISINSHPIRRPQDAPPYAVVASFTDVTERKQFEVQLRQREEHFRRLIENASDVITILEPEGRIVYTSPSVERVLGWTPAELLGRNAFDMVHPDDVAPARATYAGAFSDPGSIHTARVRYLHRDGSWRSLDVIGRSTVDEAGHPVAILNSRDVSERERQADELRFQKTLLETQMEASIDGILLVDEKGRIVSFNRRFREVWRVPDDVLASRSDDDAISSVLQTVADPDAFRDRIRHLYSHPEETSRDEIALRDGRILDRYSAPVRAADGTYYGRVWFFRDVTDRKRAEDQLRRAADETKAAYDELKRAQAQLVQSEKLASVGMLVSGVAHEINNPINVIYGNLRLLKDGAGKPPRVVKQMIRDALRAADEARGVIDVFRNFARDSRIAEPCDVNRCIKDTLGIAKRWLARIRVRTTLGRIPLVPCFPGQLNQVMLNLVKNAAEAMAGRGSITITSSRRGRSVVIDVADTGPGIPAAIRPRLFDPFFSTKPDGMGLGLSISASIVTHHGGRLRLLKSSRKGSTFRMELPIKAKS